MQGYGPFAAIPIWGIFIITLVLTTLFVEGGYRWAVRNQKNYDEHEKEAPVGAMVGATLGLLAFLLAFTFSMAADSFYQRRQALTDEINAIRITYLLTGTIGEPHRTEVRKVLREYVEERLRWAGVENAKASHSVKELHNQLWAHATAVGTQNPGGVDVFLASVSDVTSLHAKRVMLRERSRIPSTFWAVLYLVAILALASMGYHGGVAGTTRSPVMVAVAIAFSLVMMLIADLDRPGEGLINVSQRPMVELRDSLAELKF